jgi:cytochrome P450
VKDKMDAGKIDPDARVTIFQHLLTPDIVDGYVVPTVPQIKDESYSIVAAAADTTGNAMTVACFNICSQPDVYKKLVDELTTTFPDDSGRLDFLTLEKLPYLTGVVKEAIRLSFGVPGRLPREVPEPGASFNGYNVPAGTIVGMSSWVMHRNEDIFPDAMKFDPERWLNPERARYLDKYIVAFGKGTRQCVGE